MSTQFTRVTVVSPERTRIADVLLPAAEPTVEIIGRLGQEFGLYDGHQPQRLTLARLDPYQEIPLERSLSDAHIRDGAKLQLVLPRGHSGGMITEDVLDEVRGILDDDGSEFTGKARWFGGLSVAALPVFALGLMALLAGIPAANLGWPLQAGLAVTGVVAGGVLSMAAGKPHVVVALAPLLSWVALGSILAGQAKQGWAGYLLLVAAALGAGLTLFTLRSKGAFQGVVATGIAMLAGGVLGTGLLIVGVPAVGLAGILLVVCLLALGLAPQLALQRSQLVPMLRAQEDGTNAHKNSVTASVYTGQQTLTGAVAGIVVLAAIAELLLAASAQPLATVLALVAAAAFGLRARAFSRTGQVVSLLLLAVWGVVAVALGLALMLPPQVGPWVGVAVLVMLLIAAVVATNTELGEVTAARLRRTMDVLETTAVIAVAPLVLFSSGAITAVLGML